MNQSTLYRIIAAALVVLAIGQPDDTDSGNFSLLSARCWHQFQGRKIVIIPGLPSPPHHF